MHQNGIDQMKIFPGIIDIGDILNCIFCVNGNTGLCLKSRIFYLIYLQNARIL